MFTQLQILYLDRNDLQDEGAAILAEFLKAPVVLCHRVCPLTEGAVSRRGWRQEKGMHACNRDVDLAIWRLTRLTSRTSMHLRCVRRVPFEICWCFIHGFEQQSQRFGCWRILFFALEDAGASNISV